MADPTDWSLSELVLFCRQVRDSTAGATSFEEAASRVVRLLRGEAADPFEPPPFLLARLFTMEPLEQLPARLQQEVHAGWAHKGLGPRTQVLTLMATAGDEPAWCDPRESKRHRVIPLPDAETLAGTPMLAALLHQLGLNADMLVDGLPAAAVYADWGVFHVPDAVGRPEVPDQDFVARYGVRSVVGCGGVLPDGQVFLVVLFSRIAITSRAAQMFRVVAVSIKLALLPYVSAPLFERGPRRHVDERLLATAEAATLRQLLAVHESTASEQAAQLEDSVERLRAAQNQLRRETEIIDTLHVVGTALSAELELERVVQRATDAAVDVTGARFGAFFYNVINDVGESYLLYTLAGAEREEFDQFLMPRNTPVFAPTFAGEGVLRSEDITKDERYGTMSPHQGMPAGHLPVRSYLAVPVVSLNGEVHGGLFLGHDEVGMFDPRAEQLAVGVAAQAAAALDNARLYRHQQRTALELQRHLMPELVTVPGVDVAARYLPGAAGIEVGGDWYDVIPLPRGRVALVIGDVMGRGVTAAATMGQLRTAVRAYTLLDLPAAELVSHLNELALQLPGEQIITCVYAVYDPAGRYLTMANAGHVPPMIIRADGAVERLGDQLGPPLGVLTSPYEQRSYPLAAGDSIMLFTDGLVESKERDVDSGLGELQRLLEDIGDENLDAVCDKALGSMIHTESHNDDVALLLARAAP